MTRRRKGRGSTVQPDSGHKYQLRNRSQYQIPDTRTISPAKDEGKVETIEFEPLMCEFCALTFDLIEEFMIHIEDPHSHSCTLAEDCDLSFTSRLQLRDHVREVHPSNLGAGDGDDSEDQTQVADGGEYYPEGQTQAADGGEYYPEGQTQAARDGGYQADYRICKTCLLQVKKLTEKIEWKISRELDTENNEIKRGNPDEILLDDYIICQKCHPIIKTFANNIERRVSQLLS